MEGSPAALLAKAAVGDAAGVIAAVNAGAPIEYQRGNDTLASSSSS